MNDATERRPSRHTESEADRKPDREPEWKRRRRLAVIFGDVLPGTTNDERGTDGSGDFGERSGESPREEWLKSQVPPHHGNVDFYPDRN